MIDAVGRPPSVAADLPGLCERVCALLETSGAEIVLCDVRGVQTDVVTLRLRRIGADGLITTIATPGATYQAARPASMPSDNWVVVASATFDRTGTRLYVGMENGDAVMAIDTLENKVVATIPIGQAAQALLYVPDAVATGDGTQNLEPLGTAGAPVPA